MKLIKGLLAIAMISLIAVSCNETKKGVDKDTQENVEVTKNDMNEADKAVEANAEKVIDRGGRGNCFGSCYCFDQCFGR